MTCRVSGCCKPAEGYGLYCNTHKTHDRRHGHPQQEAITKAMLKPFIKTVALRRKKNPEASAWAKMESQWYALVDRCRNDHAAYLRANASHRPTRVACQEVVKVANAAEGCEVVNVVLSMFLMRDQQPHRFRTDGAFIFQVVRRVRFLADMNVGVWCNPMTGKNQRAYRDLPPQEVEIMGRWIVEALGPAGVYLAKLERQDEVNHRRRAVELSEAMGELR